MQSFTEVAETVAVIIDGLGVAVIVLGLFVATYRATVRLDPKSSRYRQFRGDLGRGILLGLELLVAADIVRTIAVPPTFEGVVLLGLIVLIRTFLSMALEVEIEGRWPWQEKRLVGTHEPPSI